ncbi:MAG: fibronectin type III domain-containing protein [Chloroflexota bacterium]|nr:fibronectin type III domain-containing protein [Chloroflexota bacterium]
MERIRGAARLAWVRVLLGVAVAVAVAVGIFLAVRGGGGEVVVAPTSTFTMETCLAYMGSGDTVPEGGPCLIVVSDGSPDSLLLEWVGGPDDATRWQYRRTTWNSGEARQDPWGPWTDIPGSDSATRAYRLTGLSSNTGHRFEVRGVAGGVEGVPSNLEGGITHRPGERPLIYVGKVVEGDGRTEWQLGSFIFTIPEGLRLVGDLSWESGNGDSGTSVQDFKGRGSLSFIHTQDVVRTHLRDDLTGAARLQFQVLLDALIASVRVLSEY